MPIFNLVCPQCGHRTRKLIADLSNLEKIFCRDCDGHYVRVGEGPTTRVVEVRDNGVMPKKVEQLVGAQELVKDRSTGSGGSGTI